MPFLMSHSNRLPEEVRRYERIALEANTNATATIAAMTIVLVTVFTPKKTWQNYRHDRERKGDKQDRFLRANVIRIDPTGDQALTTKSLPRISAELSQLGWNFRSDMSAAVRDAENLPSRVLIHRAKRTPPEMLLVSSKAPFRLPASTPLLDEQITGVSQFQETQFEEFARSSAQISDVIGRQITRPAPCGVCHSHGRFSESACHRFYPPN